MTEPLKIGNKVTVEDVLKSAESALLDNAPRWTDQDLYDAYLWGCEDDCLPEPLDKKTFLASFEDSVGVE